MSSITQIIRRLLWPWWEQGAHGKTHVELDDGRHILVDGDPWDVTTRRGDVRKALAVSNNGEDFRLFVDWVAGYAYDYVGGRVRLVRAKTRAPVKVVNALMNATRRSTAVKVVWKHCVCPLAERDGVYQLCS